jgi:hypothetical protein
MKFNSLLPLLALALWVVPSGLDAGNIPLIFKQDFERKISKSFNVDSDADVRLANKYGEINVETWDRNEVKIDVRIKVSARDEDAANDTFDRISIDFSGSSSSVSATTSLDSPNRGSWWKKLMGSSSSSDFRIYYKVMMPATVSLNTEAKYCDVMLPDLSGSTVLYVAYGDLKAGDLTNRNEISVSYGSARVEELGPESRFKIRYSEGVIRKAADLRYDGRYSETRIEEVRDLNIDAGYEEIEVGTAREVRLDGNYNDISIDHADRIFLDGNYNDFELGEITQELEVDASYGDLEVDELKAGFSRVMIDVRYIDVELDVEDNAGFTVDLSSRYGDIEVNMGSLANRKSEKSGNSERLSGTKSGSGQGKIVITTSYGDIEIN